MEIELTPDQFAVYVRQACEDAQRLAPKIRELGKPNDVMPALIAFYVAQCHGEMSLEQCEEQTLLLMRTVWLVCRDRGTVSGSDS